MLSFLRLSTQNEVFVKIIKINLAFRWANWQKLYSCIYMARNMENEYQKYFRRILKKYNQGTASKEEKEFLEAHYDTFELKDDLIVEENEADYQSIKQSIKNNVDNEIDLYNNKQRRGLRFLWLKYAAAAIILVSSSVAVYIAVNGNKKQSGGEIAYHILPGTNKATLTLSNGKRILLNDAHNGQIAQQSNISITKTAGNQIVYAATVGNSAPASELNNTITTPNGGQYSLILPDGTKVMLNASSSLTYPAAFHGNQRVVHLDGEAYFEVAKNKKMPFRVKSGNHTIEVLGTHFNINCYNDEAAIKTTLLEGSVKVTRGNDSVLIAPGQQAIVNRSGGNIIKRAVDVDKETAWKDGLFSFQNEDLKSVMRQVARWYDVKVVYAEKLPDEKFIGEISRASELSDVFKILELNNVHFEVSGKTVTVSAKLN